MSSLQTRLSELITSLGTDYKQFRTWITGSASGDLTGLATTDKTSLVSAINEVVGATGGTLPTASESTAGIVELASLAEVATGTDTARAVTAAGVRQERTALKTEILGGASAAYDTLVELQGILVNDEGVVAALATTVGNKANSSDVYLKTDLGDPNTDLAAAYTTAKA